MTVDAGFRLETERLVLRPMSMRDLDPLAQMFADPEHMRWYPSTKTRAETRDWIRWVQRGYRIFGLGLWAMDLKATGELAGQCGVTLQDVDRAQFFELGWHTRRDLWGQGLATEAGLVARDHAFDLLGLDRLISLVRPENTQSCRVAEKVGMTVLYEAIHSGFAHHVYGMSASGPRSSF